MDTANPGVAIEIDRTGRVDSESTLDNGRGVEAAHEEPALAGDRLDELSRKYADLFNQREVLTLLREQKMTAEQYRKFITEVYPIVVHFNYTLRSELHKLTEELDHPDLQYLATEALAADHVRDSTRVQEIAKEIRRTVRQVATKPDEITGRPRIDEGIYNAHSRLVAMAGQLHEEQEHNDLFRLMLEEHQIDHEQYHVGFEQYLSNLAPEDKYAYTAQVLADLRDGKESQAFPDTDLPQPVLAMHNYLSLIADNPQIPYIASHAMIAAIEFTLLKVVSESVYPGLTNYPAGESFDKEKVLFGLNNELVPGANEARDSDELPSSVLWWDAPQDKVWVAG